MDKQEYKQFLSGIADKVRKLLAVSGNRKRFKQHICDFSKKQAAYSQAIAQADKQWQTYLAKPLKPLLDRISYLKSKGWEQVDLEADSTPVNIRSSFEPDGWHYWKLPPMPPEPLLTFESVLVHKREVSIVQPPPETDEAIAYYYFLLATILNKIDDYEPIRNDTYAKQLSDSLWPIIENLCSDKGGERKHIITALDYVKEDLTKQPEEKEPGTATSSKCRVAWSQLKKALCVIAAIVAFLAALLTCLYYFGLLD